MSSRSCSTDLHSDDDASAVADRILSELAKPFDLGGQEIYASASIGIRLSRKGYDSPEDMLRDADTAMYCAKTSGKARLAVFDDSMREKAVVRLRMENDLRRALERQEFRVHYQPILLDRVASGHRLRGTRAVAAPGARDQTTPRISSRSRKRPV